MTPYARGGKRILDLALTIPAMVGLAPLFLGLMVLVRVGLGKPVFFGQTRPGLSRKPFRLWKFRTMTDASDAQGQPLPDEQRLKRLGRFLRATSLDELPELWNVLKGDMSLVGPRPLLVKYLPWYTDRENLRFNVRPGITGLAQISGRNLLPWDERLACDVQYVETISLRQDLAILWLTVFKVARREGMVELPRSEMRDLDDERRHKDPEP